MPIPGMGTVVSRTGLSLGALPEMRSWADRRTLQLLVLAKGSDVGHPR